MESLLSHFVEVVLMSPVYQVELEQTLQESQYKEQQLELSSSSLQRHLDQITEEKEEREKEAVSCFNALEVNIPPSPLLYCARVHFNMHQFLSTQTNEEH